MMTVKEAREIIESEDKAPVRQIPYQYAQAVGVLQLWNRMAPVVEALEQISYGIIESIPNENGVKLVRVRSKLEIEQLANLALKLVEDLKGK